MARVAGRREVALVTRVTVARLPGVLAPRVAAGAGEAGVAALEREARGVREASVLPSRRGHVVAILAAAREARRHVVRVRGLLEGREVAAAALGGGARVLVRALVTVACAAVESRVRGEEREARAVVDLEYLALVAPAGRGVAGGAAGTQLAPMHVLVAVGAGRPHLVEHQRSMAAPARRPRVSSLEREARRLVTERLGLDDRRPALRIVAIAAVDPDVAVRRLARALAAEDEHGDEQETGDDERQAASRQTAAGQTPLLIGERGRSRQLATIRAGHPWGRPPEQASEWQPVYHRPRSADSVLDHLIAIGDVKTFDATDRNVHFQTIVAGCFR